MNDEYYLLANNVKEEAQVPLIREFIYIISPSRKRKISIMIPVPTMCQPVSVGLLMTEANGSMALLMPHPYIIH